MQIKKGRIILSIVISIMVLLSFIIPRETLPSPDTRIILEHTYKTYIAPVCFDQANATNLLEESTLQNAQDIDYKQESSCTKDALKGERDRLITSFLKEVGIIEKKWDNW
ncbi:hypothetical protein AB3N04_00480 (plasmid) [Alkalihalophilus sp. As8PL]|uniref:Uncharacterized protein n=1 Tax=Alkalihalophilus sp. As8PL TaxID=3237103 RepID=A0AB39BP54_9BACI